MSEINNKELIKRAAKLSAKIHNALINENIGVCLHALSNVTAMLLVSIAKEESLETEDGAKMFYEDLLMGIKVAEQSIANNAKAN